MGVHIPQITEDQLLEGIAMVNKKSAEAVAEVIEQLGEEPLTCPVHPDGEEAHMPVKAAVYVLFHGFENYANSKTEDTVKILFVCPHHTEQEVRDASPIPPDDFGLLYECDEYKVYYFAWNPMTMMRHMLKEVLGVSEEEFEDAFSDLDSGDDEWDD